MNGWWPTFAFFLLAALTGPNEHPQSEAVSLEQFSFVVGNWSGTFKGYATARMPKGFEAPGTMVARWGPQHAWIESEASTEIPGLGQYSAKVVVRFDSQNKAFDSFVVNTAGNAARYSGSLSANKVVFIGQIGAVQQRVTYENVSGHEMRFFVEESHDGGVSYQPHSEILWRRN